MILSQLVAGIAIFAFFRRSDVDKRPWNTVIAPLLAIVGLGGFFVLTLDSLDVLLGVQGTMAAIMLSLVFIAFLAGAAYGALPQGRGAGAVCPRRAGAQRAGLAEPAPGSCSSTNLFHDSPRADARRYVHLSATMRTNVLNKGVGMGSAPRRARRHDPDRKERIVASALDVLARDGVAGITHRAVATAADVPLGSVTYHFATLDDLVQHAFEAHVDTLASRFEARLAACGDGDDLDRVPSPRRSPTTSPAIPTNSPSPTSCTATPCAGPRSGA